MIWNKTNSRPRCNFEPFDIACAERSRGAHDGLGRRVKVFLFLVFLSFVFSTYAQQTKDLEGRVFSKDGDVAGTHIINSITHRATITDENGFFTIEAKLNDTLVFSAVQYRRKVLPVHAAIMESRLLNVYLEEGEIKLDEVLVMPYNLSGDLFKDLDSLKIGAIVTASSLGLPNADVKPPTQSERKLYTARTWDFRVNSIKLDPLINFFSGRTKMLKERVAREAEYDNFQNTRNFYVDSLFMHSLLIPQHKIDDFMHYCVVDSAFRTLVDSHNGLKIWEYMRKKSMIYKENNDLD